MKIERAPGLGTRHDLRSHGTRIRVSDGGGGLGQPQVLAHRVAITLEAVHAVEALEEAFARYGNPDIVNTDQGSQGGFNRSSQHLNRGGVYGATSGVDAEVDRARSDAIAGCAVASA